MVHTHALTNPPDDVHQRTKPLTDPNHVSAAEILKLTSCDQSVIGFVSLPIFELSIEYVQTGNAQAMVPFLSVTDNCGVNHKSKRNQSPIVSNTLISDAQK